MFSFVFASSRHRGSNAFAYHSSDPRIQCRTATGRSHRLSGAAVEEMAGTCAGLRGTIWIVKFLCMGGWGAAPGQRDFGLKSPKQQLFQSHPPHLPKVALFPAGGQLALALLVKGQGHLKHLSSSLILY